MSLKNSAIASANPSAVANKNYINALYKEAYWRNATQAELNKFATSTVKDAANTILGATNSPFSSTWATTPVTTKVSPVAIPNPSVIKDYNVTWTSADWKTLMGTPKNQTASTVTTWTKWDTGTSKTQTEIDAEAEAKKEQDNLDAAYKYIDSSAFDDATKTLLRQIAQQQYKSDNHIYQWAEIDNIISDASLAATNALDPYYTKDTARSIEDLRNKFSDIRSSADLYTQWEKSTYAQTLKKAQQSLRASGRTFSSASRDKLWASSALGSQDVAGMEWSTPEARRLAVTAEYNKNAQKARDLWITAERYLGSSDLAWVDLWTIANPYSGWKTYNTNSNTSLYSPAGNVTTGNQDLDRLKAIEEEKQARIKALYL